ncbi:hypothetical protein UFOVP1604_188 [uncultured Caudovirales phage]|uniref:Uncharacterized protein n=1 Tax=uncultured Caudovirales phage TaxID=2100421 RepID=A0A6J5SUU0_9CAUD|nr:hypothetical protein UFOVP1604_188 [uncultured Caudovirales phage]
MEARDLEKKKIITDLTDLAQSLVIGGIRKDQPDILMLGKTLLAAIGAIETPGGADILESVLRETSNRIRVEQEPDKVLKDLLSGLGISTNG